MLHYLRDIGTQKFNGLPLKLYIVFTQYQSKLKFCK